MKEATSELNATLIIVMAIAAFVAIFFSIIWPMMKDSFESSSRCSDAICDPGYNSNYMAYCYSPKDTSKEVFECPYRG